MTFSTFLNSSSHKDTSSGYRNKTFISSPTNITPELAQELLKFVNPVTLSSTDLQGRTIQLWSYNSELVASILKDGEITIIPGDSVCNSLQPSETGSELLKRLQTGSLKKWQFAYLQGKISVWPHLIAAGRDGKWDRAGHVFPKENKPGHFNRKEDTSRNRKYIEAAVKTPDPKYTKKNDFGDQFLQRKMPEGRYAWAIVDRRGNIKSGGRNNFPKNWIKDNTCPGGMRFETPKFTKQFGKTPSTEQFRQILQQTKLTESYKSSNPNSTIGPKGGSNGQIGGVGNTTGMIKGLFDTPESIFETKHYFMIPHAANRTESGHFDLPFSDRELQQILRELAIGIYAHDTVPFFSLEFNQEGHLFPVIHPVYQNTLVGRVIGMLDYYMKGYLNGGVFKDGFVDSWSHSQQWSRPTALEQMIIFEEHIKRAGLDFNPPYVSLKMMIQRYLANQKEALKKKGVEREDDSFFEDHTKFSNSFRIIAKQNSFQKEEDFFVLDSDFDVFYTLQPDAEYQKRLKTFKAKEGRNPLGYEALDVCCQMMCQTIHEQMHTLPLAKSYFSMLGVINFFSSYFMTLKSQGVMPQLKPMVLSPSEKEKCPDLFPELPITSPGTSRLHSSAIFRQLKRKQTQAMIDYIEKPDGAPEAKKALIDEIKEYLRHELTKDKRPGEVYSLVTGVASSAIAYLSAAAATAINSIPYRSVEYTPPPTRFSPDPMPRFRTAPITDVTGLTPPQGSRILSDTQFSREQVIPRFSNAQTQGIALATLAAAGAITYGGFKATRFFTSDYAYQQRHYTGEKFEQDLEKYSEEILEKGLLDLFDQALKRHDLVRNRPGDLNPAVIRNIVAPFFVKEPPNRDAPITLENCLQQLSRDEITLPSPVNTTTIFTDTDPKTREIARSVVGGCGMALKEQAITSSPIGRELLDGYWPIFYETPQESWSLGYLPGTSKFYAGFHLNLQPTLMDEISYKGLTSIIQFKGHEEEKLERFHDILEAIVLEDKPLFLERLKDVASDDYFWKKLNRCVTEKTQDQTGRTLLHGAVLTKDTYYSKELLIRGFSANDRDIHGFLPIHYAAMAGNVEQIHLLYGWAQSPSFLAQSYSGATPLIVAIQSGHLEAVKALIAMDSFESSMTRKLTGGYTPLLAALHEGHPEIIHYLLDEQEIDPRKVDVNQATRRGITPLMLAAEMQDVAIAEKLIRKGANPNGIDKLGYKALNSALKNRDLAMIRLLAPITGHTEEIAEDLAKYGSKEVAEHFLAASPLRFPMLYKLIEKAVEEGNEAVALSCFQRLKQEEPPIKLSEPKPEHTDPTTPEEILRRAPLFNFDLPQPSIDQREASKKAQNQRLLPLLKMALKNRCSGLATELLTTFDLELTLEEGLPLIPKTDGRLLLGRVLKEGHLTEENLKIVWLTALEAKNSALLYNLLSFMDVPHSDRPSPLRALRTEKSRKTIWQLPPFLREVQQTAGRFAQWTLPYYLTFMDEPYLLFDNFSQEELFSMRLGGDEGKTLAYLAAEQGNFISFEMFLDKMEDEGVSFENQYQGRHLLYGAFESFQEDVIDRALCTFQEEINRPLDPATGVRAVHLAAGKNLVNFLEQMEGYRADFKALDHKGRSPLYYAIASGSSNAVDFFLRRNCLVTPQDMKKAQNLKGKTETEILEKLFKAGGELPPEEKPSHQVFSDIELEALAPFFEAVRNQTLGKYSKEETSRINLTKTLPASKTKHEKALPLIFDLIQRTATDELLSIDQIFSFIEIAQQQNPDLKDIEGNSLSHYLVRLKIPQDFEIPESIAQQFNPHVPNDSGITPLHLAAAIASEKTLENLLRLPGINLELEDDQGNTPLFYAVDTENLSAIQLLLSKGANPDHRNQLQITPAFTAVLKENPLAIKMLLRVCDIEKLCSIKKTTLLHQLAHTDPEGLFLEALKLTPQKAWSEDRRNGIAHILSQEGQVSSLRNLALKDFNAAISHTDKKIYPWDLAAYKGEKNVLIFYQEVYPDLFTAHHQGCANKMLQQAAVGGQRKTAGWLINQGVLEHMDRKKHLDVLKGAAVSNCQETLKLFSDIFTTPGSDYFLYNGEMEAIPAAIAHESTNSLEYFYNAQQTPKDLELSYSGFEIGSSIQVAARAKAFKSTRWLQTNGLTSQDRTAGNPTKVLEIAAEHAQALQFGYLLERAEENPFGFRNDEGQSLLQTATMIGNLKHVIILLNQAVEALNAGELTPAEFDAFINSQDQYGLTAIERATVQRRFAIARIFMLCGANETFIRKSQTMLAEILDTRIEKTLDLYREIGESFEEYRRVKEELAPGETNLHLSVKLGCKASMSLLAKKQGVEALLDQADAQGNTPLHLATIKKDLSAMRLLTVRGANFGAKNDRGDTPLHIATIQNSKQAALLLVTCDPNKKSPLFDIRGAPNVNAQGARPIDIAFSMGHQEIARLLEEHLKQVTNKTPQRQAAFV